MNAALETLMLVFSNEDALPLPKRALFLGAEPHADLAKWPEVKGLQHSKPLADAWKNAGFELMDEPEGKWPLVLVLPGKSKEETLAWFAMARDHLQPGGHLVVAMPNTAGAGRFEKELGKATAAVTSLQKNKCRAFYAAEDGSWDEQRFAEWRALDGIREIDGFTTKAGIFSCDHIDSGSRLLAEHLPAYLHGQVADLGAGWGFLSDAVLKRCPNVRRIDLYEADARALACARLNLASHATEMGFHWHDVTTGIPGTYDSVVMNPPFHTGQATDIELGRAFLKTAAAALKRGGRLLLVANRQLPYESVLDSLGLIWRKTAEDKTFKLLFCEKR